MILRQPLAPIQRFCRSSTGCVIWRLWATDLVGSLSSVEFVWCRRKWTRTGGSYSCRKCKSSPTESLIGNLGLGSKKLMRRFGTPALILSCPSKLCKVCGRSGYSLRQQERSLASCVVILGRWQERQEA